MPYVIILLCLYNARWFYLSRGLSLPSQSISNLSILFFNVLHHYYIFQIRKIVTEKKPRHIYQSNSISIQKSRGRGWWNILPIPEKYIIKSCSKSWRRRKQHQLFFAGWWPDNKTEMCHHSFFCVYSYHTRKTCPRYKSAYLRTGHYLWQGWGPKRKWWGNWKIILALGGVAKKSLHVEVG